MVVEDRRRQEYSRPVIAKGKTTLHLYPLELSSATVQSSQPKKLKSGVKEFEPNEPGAAKKKALEKIGQIISDTKDS